MRVDGDHLSWGLVLIAFGWLAIALVQGCGGGPIACEDPAVSKIESKIVNGQKSTERRSTVFVGGDGGYCSGTIIGPHTVLTAAHCENMTRVCLGFNQSCYPVTEDIERPGANKPGARDLRILHTDHELPEPYAAFGLLEDCDTYIAQGYGFGSNRELHEREVAVCFDNFGILLASEGICNGDSGGPLYCGDTLVGVSSFGYGAPRVCDGTTGFVNLEADNNLDWIEENLR